MKMKGGPSDLPYLILNGSVASATVTLTGLDLKKSHLPGDLGVQSLSSVAGAKILESFDVDRLADPIQLIASKDSRI